MQNIDIDALKLAFGFARIGAPDPDSLHVVDGIAVTVVSFLEQLEQEMRKQVAAAQTGEPTAI